MKLSSLGADLRALGWGAPLRATYELSKRTGFHGFIFRGTLRKPLPEFQTPFRAPSNIGPAAHARALTAAQRITAGQIEVFGTIVAIGSPPDWHRIIHTEGSWPLLPWWKIDIRSRHRLGDIKWAWELGRHRHLVLLARAVFLDPAENRYLEVLETHLRSWFEQNPPEKGVHWYSNLELALRGIAWLQVLSLATAIDREIVTKMQRTLYLMGRHLFLDLPQTVSSMRNNHLIGDGLGMVAIGLAFPGDKAAERWVRIGDRVLTGQLERHFCKDGSSIEDSVSYNRFVLEMLIVRVLLGDPPQVVLEKLSQSAEYLTRLGLLESVVPQFGDWDEGRVLAVTEHPEDLAGSLELALALTGTDRPQRLSEPTDEFAWYSPPGAAPRRGSVAIRSGGDAGGGVGRAEAAEWKVWLKAGSGRSHGHADLLSSPIMFRSQWVVGDPGTGTYNGPIEQRNYFRSSLAHNVVRVDNTAQLEPHRVFRWHQSASSRLGQPVTLGKTVIMWGIHDAYTRLDPQRTVARVVVLSDTGVMVADWVGGAEPVALATSLPLAPDAGWEAARIVLLDGTLVTLHTPSKVRSVKGQSQPFDGWWSRTYGSIEPATRIELTSERSPLAWAVSTDGALRPEVQPDRTVTMQDITLRVTFSRNVTLSVQTGNTRLERTLQ